MYSAIKKFGQLASFAFILGFLFTEGKSYISINFHAEWSLITSYDSWKRDKTTETYYLCISKLDNNLPKSDVLTSLRGMKSDIYLRRVMIWDLH